MSKFSIFLFKYSKLSGTIPQCTMQVLYCLEIYFIISYNNSVFPVPAPPFIPNNFVPLLSLSNKSFFISVCLSVKKYWQFKNLSGVFIGDIKYSLG